MVTYSIIQKSQLEGALRLDAEYYQPEYLEITKELKNAKRVGDLVSDIRYGLYVEPEYLEKGVDFIRALNLLSFWVDGEILKIDEKKVPPSYKLKVGDSLIVRSGANTGYAGLVYPKFEGATFGSYTIRLRFNKINPFFATIFLNTKYGFLQTKRLQTGMAQPNLNIPNIKEIKIPIISEFQQKDIENTCLEVEKYRQQSEAFYSQAENLFLDELGLKDFKIEDDLSYIVNLSEIKSAHRADAEYFQPNYEKLIKVVARKFEIQDLKQVFIFKRGVFIPTKYYTEEKTSRPYIRIKELSGGKSGIDESKVIFVDGQYPEDKNNILKENDLVIAIIGGTIGKINRISKELANGFCSNNMGRLRIKSEWNSKIAPEFSEVLFQSIFIQSQIEQKKAQTGQPKIGDSEVKSIKIPILPKPTQLKIADLVQKSHESRKRAKQLLEEAKQKVEKLIKE